MTPVPSFALPLCAAVWLLAACGPAWRPARPERMTALHARLDRLEQEIMRGGEQRKDSLRDTVKKTREINEISADRYHFFNAVVRLWTRLHQDLEVVGRSLDQTDQDLEYLEKSTELGHARLQAARAEFKFDYHNALTGLLEVLCPRKPGSWPCVEGPEEKEEHP